MSTISEKKPIPPTSRTLLCYSNSELHLHSSHLVHAVLLIKLYFIICNFLCFNLILISKVGLPLSIIVALFVIKVIVKVSSKRDALKTPPTLWLTSIYFYRSLTFAAILL